jgi:hypothetical protein
VNLVVAGHTQVLGQETDEENRQSAVHEKREAGIVRVQGGTVGVEVLPDRTRDPDPRLDHGQESFVRMQVGLTVPVEPDQAQRTGDEQDRHKRDLR